MWGGRKIDGNAADGKEKPMFLMAERKDSLASLTAASAGTTIIQNAGSPPDRSHSAANLNTP
jgi:hypothetical protein